MRPPTGHSTTWLKVFGFTLVATVAWVLATPLMTGPDEVSQARRAAAVARGQILGDRLGSGPPLVLEVSVPELYGEPADQQWRCFLGPLVSGTPQEPLRVPPSECPALDGGPALVDASTVQYRGQPFFYALSGLPTLVSTGPAGAYGMRLVGALITAALVASTATTLRRAPEPSLAGLALLAAMTPAMVYLAASTNPSAVEVMAALCAWAAGMALARGAGPDDPWLIARFGAATAVLTLTRGLSPLFAVAIVGGCAFVAGWPRCRALLARRDVRWWAGVVGLATLVSVGWLARIAQAYPLPERAGSGWATAVGYLPWYLRQSVGVFGTNDSALAPEATALWVAAWVLIVVWGLAALVRHQPRRARRPVLVTAGCVVVGLGLQVTAEGLSLPPIGFFWQGRYALPLLLGALVVATSFGPVRSGADRPGMHRGLIGALGAGFVVLHSWAFVVVARHHGGVGDGAVGVVDAFLRPGWEPPVPLWVSGSGLIVGLIGLAITLLARGGPWVRSGPLPVASDPPVPVP